MLPRPDKMDELETCLQRELTDTKPRMIGIKGEWGVGKTFRWNQIWKERKSSDHSLRKKKYSYVSLFGIESIDRLRREILGRIQLSGGTKRPGKNSPLRRANQFLRSSKFKGTGAPLVLADWIEDWLISGGTICLDDIERMSSKLSVASVFGYLNFLKEERDCTIVLIFNEEKLHKSQKKDLAYYREKVLDREFLYDPAIEENLKIALNGEGHQAAKEVFLKAENNNLRLMLKVREIIEYFKLNLQHNFPDLWDVFAGNCAKVVLVYHSTKNLKIKDYLLNTSSLLIWVKESTIPSEIKELFQKISYTPFESNALILDYIEKGSVDLGKNQGVLRSDDQRQQSNSLEAELSEIIDLYRLNFQCEKDFFVYRLNEFLEKNGDQLRLVDLSAAVQLLRDLCSEKDFQPIFDRAADAFVEKGGDRNSLRTLPSLDNSLRKMVQTKLDEADSQRSLEEIFLSLSREGGYEPEDVQALEKFSKGEIADWVLHSKRKDLIPRLRNLKVRLVKSTKEHPKAQKLLEEALSIVKEKSAFKKYQVESLLEQ